MVHTVFISYSTADVRIAEQVCAALEHAGIGCWIAPRDAQPGDKYQGSIIRAIRECRAVVLLFSAHSNRSEHVFREVHAASEAHKPIVPMRLDSVQPSDDLSYYLAPLHRLDAQLPPLERHIERLIEVLTPLVGEGLAQPATATPQQPAALRMLRVRRRVWGIATGVVLVAGSAFGASYLAVTPNTKTMDEPTQGPLTPADPAVEDRSSDVSDTASGTAAKGSVPAEAAELRIEEASGGGAVDDQRARVSPAPRDVPVAPAQKDSNEAADPALRKELLGQQLTRLISDPPPTQQTLDEIRAATVAIYHAGGTSAEDRATAAYILGAAWRQQGNADECAVWLRRALQLRPDHPHYVRALERCADGS